MDDFVQAFEERLLEIEAYLDFLDTVEKQVQNGPPKIGGTTITVEQQRILYSSVYLQLYNLIEATVTRCVEAFSLAIEEKGPWQAGDLTLNLRREWVRTKAQTHIELNYDNRLESALTLCDHLVQALPVTAFEIERGGGGNWDDKEIENISDRLGLSLDISRKSFRGVKRHFRNEQGPLEFIKTLRNSLAHGNLSFAECGEGISVHELRDLKERTAIYLREVAKSFKTSIDAYEFLLPERRPPQTGTSQ